MVVEGVWNPSPSPSRQRFRCPTIGIGASAHCDGQVLVAEDMLGMFERVPRFVKRYHEVANEISDAAARYAADVRARAFPTQDQTYQPK
jgi:3-methyl-2-oxobutanoate hydroxymethyltransferase